MANLISQPTPIQTVYTWYRGDRLFVNRRYQRKLVWTLEEKQKLVDSLLRKYPVPAILLAESESRYEIIDGLQRLNAIMSFIENSFPTLDGKYFDLDYFPTAKDLAKKKVIDENTEGEKISSDQCSTILNYSVAASIMQGAEEAEINDVFDRINTYGHRLSDQERRQSGVTNKFAELVRETACAYRGDVSHDVLPLHEMPSISVDLPKTRHGYDIRAEEVFWVKHGVVRSTDLRDSMDEQVVADIFACVVGGQLIDRSKSALDSIYEPGAAENERIAAALDTYGSQKVSDEVKYCISELLLACSEGEESLLKNILFPKPNNNAFPAVFAGLILALHEIIIGEQKILSDSVGFKKSLNGIAAKMDAGQKGSTREQRRTNIDVVKGIVGKHFVPEKNLGKLVYADHQVIDIEGYLRRAQIETSYFELKQGLLNLAPDQLDPSAMLAKLPEILCALANNGISVGGKLILGVSNDLADAKRAVDVDGVQYREVGSRFVVGVDREAARLGKSKEDYFQMVRDAISKSELSEPLKSDVLSCIDYNSYFGLGIVVVSVRPQKALSTLGDDVFFRSGDETKRATTGKEIAMIAQRFSSGG